MNDNNKVPHSMVNLRMPRAGGGGMTAIRVGSGAAAGFSSGGGGGGAVAGVNGSVQFNMNGSPGGDANLTWDYTNQEFGIVSKAGQAGLTVKNGYIASDGGFDALQSGWNAFQGAPTGAGAYLAGVGVAPYIPTTPTPGAPNGGYIDLADLGYANYPVPLDGAQFAQPQVLLWNSGTNGTQPGDVNTTTGLMTNAFIDAAGGFKTEAPEWNAIQAPSGGVFGRSLTALDYIHIGNMPADPIPGVTMTYGDDLHPGTMYWNTTIGAAMIYNGTQFVPLGGGGNPAGQWGSVQYNNGGVFGGDGNFLWNPTSQELGIIAVSGQAGITVDNGYTQSAGFVSTLNSWQAIDAVSDAGGFGGGALTAGYGLTPFQGRGGYIDIAPLVNQGYPVPLPGLNAFGANDVLLWVAGQNDTPSLTNVYGLQCSSWIDAAEGFATGDPRYNSVQTTGGLNGRSLAVTDYIQVGHSASDPATGPATTPGDTFQQGALYWNDQKGTLMVFTGGTGSPPNTWISVGIGGTWGINGLFGSVQYNLNGSLTGDANFLWNPQVQELFVNGMSGQAAITVSSGYIDSAGGFATGEPAFNAIKASSGGVYGLSLHAEYYIDPGEHYGPPPLSPGTFSFRPGSISFDTSVSKLMYFNGTNWVPLGGAGGASGINGSFGSVQYNVNGLLTGDANFLWSPSAQEFYVNGVPGQAAITVSNGYINSAGGLITGAAAYNAIQAPNGGVYGLSLHAENYIDIGDHFGIPPFTAGTSSFRPGTLYWDTSIGTARMWDGVQWFSLGAGLSGLQVPCVTFATSATTLGTSPNMFWEASTNSLGVSAIGVNGLSGNSQVRISTGRNDYGMYLTSGSSGQANIAGGASWVGGWLAHDPNPTILDMNGGVIRFYCNAGVGGYYGPTQRMALDYVGNLSVQSGVYARDFVMNANAGSLWAINNFGVQRQILTLSTDNNLYLQNVSDGDIYIRPTAGRYVFMGLGQGEWICPDGNATAYLGAPWYRWTGLYVYGLDVAGSVTGVTRTVNGLSGDVGIAAGTGVSIYNSGNSVVINSTGGAGNPFNQSLNTYNDVTFNTVTTVGVVQAGAASGVTFQNTNFKFQVDSGGNLSSQSVATNALYCQGFACCTWGGVWVGGGVQTPNAIYGSDFGVYNRYLGWPGGGNLGSIWISHADGTGQYTRVDVCAGLVVGVY